MTDNRLGDYFDPMRQAAGDALIFVEGSSTTNEPSKPSS